MVIVAEETPPDERKETKMRRPWLTGIVAGVMTTVVLAMVGIGGYRLGERNGRTIEVVTSGELGTSEGRVIVADGWGHGWHGGPGFGFGFLFLPLLVIGIIWLVGSRRHGGWCPPPPRERPHDPAA